MGSRKKKKLLTVAIMVKNEEERITRTLGSVIKYADQVVILDTGSTDNTVRVVKDFCAEKQVPLKLEEEPFIDFATSRNNMLQMCYGLSEFILLLDSNDEVKHPKTMIAFLKCKVKERRECVFGCKFVWINDGGIKDNNRTYYKIGIIRNSMDEIYYEYPVHEYITCSNPGKYISNNSLERTDFHIFQDRMKDKSSVPRIKKDIGVLENYVKIYGEEERAYRFICQSCHVLQNYNKLYKYAKLLQDLIFRTIEKRGNKPRTRKKYIGNTLITEKDEFMDNLFYAHMSLGKAMVKKGDPDFYKEYEKAYEHCLHIFKNCEPYYEIAGHYFKGGKLEEAYPYVRKCCDIEEPKGYIGQTQINYQVYKKKRWELLLRIAQALGKKKDYDDACFILYGKRGLSIINSPLYNLPKGLTPLTKNSENNSAEEVLNNPKISDKAKDKIRELLAKHTPGPPGPQVRENMEEEIAEFQKRTEGHRLNIIVSYRDRLKQLKEFLPWMTRYVKFIDVDYRILIVEQMDSAPFTSLTQPFTSKFNKGLLYNMGARYVLDNTNNLDKEYLCFHDVDILPQKGTKYYLPDENSVTHLYGHKHCLGGVFLITMNNYLEVNGFSNLYEGWGMEDNDFLRRVVTLGLRVDRSYFYERFDTYCFKEIDDAHTIKEKKTELGEKMELPQTKKNIVIFEKDLGGGFDDLRDITSLEIIPVKGYTLVRCDVPKLLEVNEINLK